VLYVAACAGEEIIDTDDNCSLLQEALAKMRSEKAGPTRDQDAFLEMHDSLPNLSQPFDVTNREPAATLPAAT
jgi:hypothetical protein